jgi:hypothetical protein
MRVNVQKMMKALAKWKNDGHETIDLVILFNIARDLAVSESE